MSKKDQLTSKERDKITREFRREARKLARDEFQMISSAMKPKPKWVPWRLWLWGAGIFIKIK